MLLRLWCLRLLVSSVPGFRVLATWGPLLVLCSLCSPASEFLSFFLRIFQGSSSMISSSHCWSLLNWRRLSVFRPASAGGRYTLWPSGWRLRSSASADRSRPGMGGRLSSPPSGEAGGGTSCTLDAWCIGRNFFPVNPGSSRLSLVWWIRRACASVLLPRPLGAVGGLSDFSPADFSSLQLCLVERI